MALVTTSFAKMAVLNAMRVVPASPPWDGALVGLYVNDVSPGSSTVTADLVEPTWAAYARQPVTWQAAYASAGGTASLVGGSVFFVSAADTDVIVRGYLVVSSAGLLLWAERLAAPIPVGGATLLGVVPMFRLS